MGESGSLEQALRAATDRLAEAGVPTPRADAELLAAHLLGTSRGRVAALALAGTPAPAGLADLVAERCRRVPLQHLTGTAYFRHLELAVGPGVFVPRPETETVAQLAIDAAAALAAAGRRPRVVDLGTGSGAIAAAVASEVPAAEVTAVEVSGLAAAWAERNLAPHGVRLVLGDLREALPDEAARFDVVVSNPPYIPPDAVPGDPEVRDHDPELALYGGGPDGLELPAAVAAAALRLLVPGGLLVMEHAEVQAPAIARMLARGGWDAVASHPDLTGRPRATSARHRAEGAAMEEWTP